MEPWSASKYSRAFGGKIGIEHRQGDVGMD